MVDYVKKYRKEIKKRYGPSSQQRTSSHDDLKEFFLITVPPFQSNKRRNRFKRKLYGYTVKNDDKVYEVDGLFNKLNCEEVNKRAFFVPRNSAERILKLLKDHGIDFGITQVWKKR